jgi:hypothetical protein
MTGAKSNTSAEDPVLSSSLASGCRLPASWYLIHNPLIAFRSLDIWTESALETIVGHRVSAQANAVKLKGRVITDATIEEVEAFCEQVAKGLDNVDFEDKRRILELLDVQGTVIEEGGKQGIALTEAFPQKRDISIVISTLRCANHNRGDPVSFTATIILKAIQKGKDAQNAGQDCILLGHGKDHVRAPGDLKPGGTREWILKWLEVQRIVHHDEQGPWIELEGLFPTGEVGLSSKTSRRYRQSPHADHPCER